MRIQSKETGRQHEVTKQHWQDMKARGDDRYFRVISTDDIPILVDVHDVTPGEVKEFIPKFTEKEKDLWPEMQEPEPQPEPKQKKPVKKSKHKITEV